MSTDVMSQEPLAQPPLTKRRSAPWLNVKLLVAGVVLILAVGFLIFNAMDGQGAYYMTVSELATSPEAAAGEQVRAGGNVVAGTIQRGELGDAVKFEMTDGTSKMPVVYDGVVPDIFADHAEVIVTGTIRPDGVFEANELLTKCPSRFESADEAAT
jgi:cytochrome c-type biogenesis protein CcmE